MSHKHKKRQTHHHFCDRPRTFHDTVGKGTLDSTPIIVPKVAIYEIGTVDHPGPFVAQAFNPSGQLFIGLSPRRNTPNTSPEKAGKILVDDKKHGDDRFYEPRIKHAHKANRKSDKKKTR